MCILVTDLIPLYLDVKSLISYINNIVESCVFGSIEVYILFDGILIMASSAESFYLLV